MKKVYIVLFCEFLEETIERAFLSRKDAEKYVEDNTKSIDTNKYSYSISECILEGDPENENETEI